MAPTHRTRELRHEDRESLLDLLDRVPQDEAMLLRPDAARFDDFPGWWFGALDGQRLEAAMSVEGHSGRICSADDGALRAMARALLQQQQMIGGRGAQHHQLAGSWRSMDLFWGIFKEVGRKVIADTARDLMETTEQTASPSKRVVVSVAGGSDLRLVVDYLGQRGVELMGFDPRRTAPEAHEARCRQAIADGRQLVAREKTGRPFMVAEIVPLAGGAVALDRVFVPAPMRGRKRLVGGGLALAAAAAAPGGKVMVFADGEAMVAAAERAGFARRARYRQIAMVG